MKRVVIAAGGTGGHFYPGLVAAQTFKARGWEPLMVVRVGDPALVALEAAGIPALPVDLRGLPRRPSPDVFIFAAKLVGSLGLLARAFRSFKPDLAVGMGGYLSFPLVYAAWRRGVPRAVHESNSILGLANLAATKLGARLFWGLPPADANAEGTLVGTPIRPALLARRGREESRLSLGLHRELPTLLVFGGSQGAQAINSAVPLALKATAGIQVLHLAGRGKADAAASAYRDAGVRADVREYLEDMTAAYGAADLVLCRAGASTLAELFAQRAPAILVPYPHAAADHQDANARAFARAGAVARVPENELAARLGALLGDLLKSPQAQARRLEMARAYVSLGLPQPDQTPAVFVDALEKLATK